MNLIVELHLEHWKMSLPVNNHEFTVFINFPINPPSIGTKILSEFFNSNYLNLNFFQHNHNTLTYHVKMLRKM